MKTFRPRGGPFHERPFYEAYEIEEICSAELKKAGLYPSDPAPVRIERFVEKRFGISVAYEDLLEGFLGYSRFGSRGLESVVVSRILIEDNSQSAQRRANTTIAHEVGHALLHAHLFVLGAPQPTLFGGEVTTPKILCRSESVTGHTHAKKYDGRWWEFQANQAIGPLLLPRDLVGRAMAPFLQTVGLLQAYQQISHEQEDQAVTVISDTFDVNPVVARIRLAELYPAKGHQLTL